MCSFIKCRWVVRYCTLNAVQFCENGLVHVLCFNFMFFYLIFFQIHYDVTWINKFINLERIQKNPNEIFSNYHGFFLIDFRLWNYWMSNKHVESSIIGKKQINVVLKFVFNVLSLIDKTFRQIQFENERKKYYVVVIWLFQALKLNWFSRKQ